MNSVQAPLNLLEDSRITPAAKIVWLIASHEPGTADLSRFTTADLAAKAGLARSAISDALKQLAASGWAAHMRNLPRRGGGRSARNWTCVPIPIDILSDCHISPQARIVYGLLAHLTGKSGEGAFTYRHLAESFQLDERTIRRTIRELQSAGWLETTRPTRRSPVNIRLRNPARVHNEQELELARRRIARAPFLGEALMREYLSLIVDSDEFEDDASPGFLINPLTNERLQFDRFYPKALPHPVAFEFNGPQHYGRTEKFSAEEAAAQRVRDLIKTGICAERGISLVVVRPRDLSLGGMKAKVGNLLPQRKLPARTPLIDYLESTAASYRRAAHRGFAAGNIAGRIPPGR